MLLDLAAVLVGLVVGAIGTIVGAGGGFLLVPILTLAEPQWSTATITAFSLAVVAANATSGATAYWRQGRVDLVTFPIFAAAALPGAILGAIATRYIPRAAFDPAFGSVLILIAIWLVIRPRTMFAQRTSGMHRVLVDCAGNRYDWSFQLPLGIAAAAVVGFVSSILGIGGGIIHVPFMITVLGFPAHVATATSHAVLAVTAIVGTLVHIAQGSYRETAVPTLLTALGALLGAPLGARLSRRLPGIVITRILALALASVGLRLLFSR